LLIVPRGEEEKTDSDYMADASAGALVPSVMKAEVLRPSGGAAAAVSSSEMTDAAAAGAPLTARATAVETEEEEEETKKRAFDDKDLLCPICMGLIKDAFLTACGHSFCYMCIVTHLHNKSDCPCCAHYLTKNHLFPNFLLNKVCFW